MMRPIARAIALTAVAGLFGGCILVVHDQDDGGVEADWISSYEDEATARRENNVVLADRVSRRLEEIPSLQSEDITVTASGQVVTLFGRLNSPDSLQQAVAAAGEVDGVARVVSRITLDVRS